MSTRSRAKKAVTIVNPPESSSNKSIETGSSTVHEIKSLHVRTQQNETSLIALESAREELEAATAQTIKELKAEISRMREKLVKMSDAFRELKSDHQKLRVRSTEQDAILTTIQQTVDQLSQRSTRCIDACSETASTDEALDADTRDLAARVAECKAKQYRGGTRAEDMMEPLSEVSSCTGTSHATGYAHSSIDSVRAALAISLGRG